MLVAPAWDIAGRDGLAAVTLREVAAMIGMRSPSLYSHFDSKNAIYDAMFGQAWTDFLAEAERNLPNLLVLDEPTVAMDVETRLLHEAMGRIGITDDADIDLFLALGGGLIDRQLANEPGGDRWLRQLPRVIDMFADDLDLPGPPLRRRP